MNKASHVLVGNLLCERLKHEFGVYLNKQSFLLGNILPDINGTFLIKPHLLKNYQLFTKRLIQNTLDEKQTSVFCGKKFSRNLGIICHYYADFFCYPHRPDYTGDIVSHVNYEKDLYRYLQSKTFIGYEQKLISEFQIRADERMLFSSLSALQESYLLKDQSFENDITFCITACLTMLILITKTSLLEQTDGYELCYPA